MTKSRNAPDPYRAPAVEVTQKERLPRRENRFGTVRITAWFYAIYLGAVMPLVGIARAEAGTPVEEQIAYFVLLVPLAIAAWSATRRWRLGYYACFLYSLLFLFMPPIGTVIGYNMLRALRRNRESFFGAKPARVTAPAAGARG